MKEKIGNFILTDAENIPIKNGGVDFVICTEVVEHLPHPESCFREISRILKKDGFAYITTPNRQEIFAHGINASIRKILQILKLYDRILRFGIKRGWFTKSSYLLTKLTQQQPLHISEMSRSEFLVHLNNSKLRVVKSYEAPLHYSLFSPFARFNPVVALYKKLDSLSFLGKYKHIAALVCKADH